MKYGITAAMLALLATAGAVAKPAPSSTAMKRQWLAANEECRGGQHGPSDSVCLRRDRLGTALERRGICWAYSDVNVYPFDYGWHPCSQARPTRRR